MSRQRDFLNSRQQMPRLQRSSTPARPAAASLPPRATRRRARRPSRLHVATKVKLESVFTYPFWENGMLVILLAALLYTSLCFFIYVI